MNREATLAGVTVEGLPLHGVLDGGSYKAKLKGGWIRFVIRETKTGARRDE